MPIHKTQSGYKWGDHGHVYPTREGAEKQAQAAYANGYKGMVDGGEVNQMKELHRKILQHLLEQEVAGAKHDVVSSILGHDEGDKKKEDEHNAVDGAVDTVHEPGEDVHALDAPDREPQVPSEPEPTGSKDEDEDDEDEHTKNIVRAFMGK